MIEVANLTGASKPAEEVSDQNRGVHTISGINEAAHQSPKPKYDFEFSKLPDFGDMANTAEPNAQPAKERTDALHDHLGTSSIEAKQTKGETANGPGSGRLLDFNAVMRRVPAARSTIYQWIKLGVFPPGRRVGPRKRLWTETEIDQFVSGEWGCDPPPNG